MSELPGMWEEADFIDNSQDDKNEFREHEKMSAYAAQVRIGYEDLLSRGRIHTECIYDNPYCGGCEE
jgi:hypothetical protein